MATLGDLVIKMSLDAAGFQSDMGKAAYQAEKGMAQIVAAGNIAATAITGFATAAVAAFAGLVGALPDIARQVAEQADALEESAEAAGMTAQSYQQLQSAMALAGVDAQKFASGIAKLNTSIVAAAQGSPKVSDAFKRLGISVTDANGNLKTTEEVIRELNTAFKEFPAGPERSALAVELLGRAGAQWIPALTSDLDELKQHAEDAGAVMSEGLRGAAEGFERSSEMLDQSLQGLRNTIAEGLLPAWAAFKESMSAMIDQMLTAEERAQAVALMQDIFRTALRAAAIAIAFVVDVLVEMRDILKQVYDTAALAVKGMWALAEAANRVLALDTEGARKALSDFGKDIDKFVQDTNKRLERQQLHVTVAAAFDAAEGRALSPKRGADIGRQRAPGIEGRAKNIKDGADKAARELEAAERRLRQLEERNAREAQQQHQKELDEMLKGWNEEARAQEAADKRLQQLAEKNAEELRRQHEKELADMLRQMEEAKRVREQYEEIFTGSLADAMVDIVEGTKSVSEAFADMGKSIAHSIAQIAAKKLATQLAEGLFGTAADSGSWWGTIAGVMGGGRAFGGSFQAGQVIKVGERGPEYIRPLTAGYVEPMQAAKTENNSVSVNMSIATPDAASFRRSEGQILTSMGLATQRALARR